MPALRVQIPQVGLEHDEGESSDAGVSEISEVERFDQRYRRGSKVEGLDGARNMPEQKLNWLARQRTGAPRQRTLVLPGKSGPEGKT